MHDVLSALRAYADAALDVGAQSRTEWVDYAAWDDATARMEALPESALVELEEIARSAPPELAVYATQWAKRMRQKAASAAIERTLAGAPAEARAAALADAFYAIGSGDEERDALLRRLTDDPDARFVADVLFELVRRGPPGELDRRLRGCGRLAARPIGRATRALLEHRPEDAEPVLRALLEMPLSVGPTVAVVLAGQVDTSPLAARIERAWHGLGVEPRRAIVRALGDAPYPARARSAPPFLSDPDTEVRAAAVGVLHACAEPNALDALLERLHHEPEVMTRAGAVSALAILAERRAGVRERVLAALRAHVDADVSVQQTVTRAIASLTRTPGA